MLDFDHVITVRAPELPRRLATLLAARNLTAKTVADISDVSENTLSKWKRGETVVRVDNATAVAQALGVEIEELLGKPFHNGHAPAPADDLASVFQTFVRDVAAIDREQPASETPDLLRLFRDARALIDRIESALPAAVADNAGAQQLDKVVARARTLVDRGATE